MNAQRVRRHAIHGLHHLQSLHLAELRQAQIGEEEDRGRDLAHLKSGRKRRPVQHGTQAAQAEGKAEFLGGSGQHPVDGPAFLGPAGHPCDHERGSQLPAKQGYGEIDLVEGQLGQRRVHEVNAFQQTGARKAPCARDCDVQVVGFSSCDVSRGGAIHVGELFDHSRKQPPSE